MRWTLRIGAGLVLAWTLFVLSPYVALYRLAQAVESRDAAAIAKRLNVRAIRVSLAQQIASAAIGLAAGEREIAVGQRQLATDAAAALVEPLVEQLVTAEGTIDLLADGLPTAVADEPGAAPGGLRIRSLAQLWRLYLNTETRGFRSVFVSFPPKRPPDERFRLRLRLQNLNWRLTDVELPIKLRVRLARTLLRDGAAKKPEPGALKSTLPPPAMADQAKP